MSDVELSAEEVRAIVSRVVRDTAFSPWYLQGEIYVALLGAKAKKKLEET